MGSFHLSLIIGTVALTNSLTATAHTTIKHVPGIGDGEEPSYLPDASSTSASTTSFTPPIQSEAAAAAAAGLTPTWSHPTSWQPTNWPPATVVPDEPPYQSLPVAEGSWSSNTSALAVRLSTSSRSDTGSTRSVTDRPSLTASPTDTMISTLTATSDPGERVVTDDDGVRGTASVVSAAAAAAASSAASLADVTLSLAASTSANDNGDGDSAAAGRIVEMRALWMVAGGTVGSAAWLV